jgi:hypothetical protein
MGIVPPNSARASALTPNSSVTMAEATMAGKTQGFGMAICLVVGALNFY